MSGDPETILEELRRDFSGELQIGGPTLAAGFIRRGLVDEYELVVQPVILGGGTRFFPDLERPAGLRLLETRTSRRASSTSGSRPADFWAARAGVAASGRTAWEPACPSRATGSDVMG
jgi:dihydrofolate reductase